MGRAIKKEMHDIVKIGEATVLRGLFAGKEKMICQSNIQEEYDRSQHREAAKETPTKFLLMKKVHRKNTSPNGAKKANRIRKQATKQYND